MGGAGVPEWKESGAGGSGEEGRGLLNSGSGGGIPWTCVSDLAYLL